MTNIVQENISDYAAKAYLSYAMSVVTGRAIPSVEDGLKAVHRRILYSMYKLGIDHNAAPVKCARVVGDTIGILHPHGDQAVYEALVRQAQDFSMRYPIIEGIGNFGSRDGDTAAAYRYTETKLYPIAETFLKELNQGAADFIPNFDNHSQEPRRMPARLPFVILNSNPGIGVGLATEIPSHNLNEVVNAIIHMLEHKNVELKDVLEYIQGPDFPTGCQLISSKEEITKVYAEGRGAFRLRSKYKVENPGTKNWKLVFYEIPYGVSPKQVMEEVDKVFNPMPKEKGGKKIFSPEQTRLKLLFQNIIDTYNDESDKDNPIRLVIEPKSFKQDPEELAKILLASTSLECNFNANFTVMGRDGNPTQKTLMEILGEWIDFRLETIDKRCRFHIKKIEDRLHILEGRKKVLDHLDEVIAIIRNSEDPKKDLIDKFGLSEIQAQDILELRLRQISNMEFKSIVKEMAELNKTLSELQKIISSEANLKKQMVKELKEDLTKYGDVRKTEFCASAKSDFSIVSENTAKVNEEKISLAISEKGWVKVAKGEKKKEDFAFKEGDSVLHVFHCMNTDTLGVFDNEGRIYNYPLHEIQKDGAPIATLVNLTSKYEIAFPFNENHKYLIYTNRGYGFITAGANLSTKLKAGKNLLDVPAGAKIMQPLFMHKDENLENIHLFLINSDSKILGYKLNLVSEIAKGKGVALLGLTAEQTIKETMLIRDGKISVINKTDGTKTIDFVNDDFIGLLQNRSSSAKGKHVMVKKKPIEIEFNREVKEELKEETKEEEPTE